MNTQINNFPDLGGMFQQMKVIDKLREVSPETLIGLSIHQALDNKRPLGSVLKMVIDGYTDAPLVMLDVVPQETINLIKSLLYK
jgi:hypothetical protein